MKNPILTKEQFDSLYNCCNEFVFLMKKIDDDYSYVYISRSARVIFKESPINKTLSECICNELLKPIVENYNKAVDENKQVIYRDFYLFSDSKVTNETIVNPIFFEGEIYILAITKEVSVQKDIEEKYLFLQSLVKTSMDSIVILSKELTIFDVNPTFQENFGCSIEDWKGKPFIDLPIIQPVDHPYIISDLVRASKGSGKSSCFLRFTKVNGEISQFIVSFSPIYKDSDVVAIYISMQELTRDIQLADVVRNTQNMLDIYKEALSTTTALVATDQNGFIEYVNDKFIGLSKYSREELIGKPIQMLNKEFLSEEHFNTIKDSLKQGQAWRGESYSHTKTGEIFWLDVTIIPILNREGATEQYLFVSFDVTDKKMIMSELRNIEKTFRLITENTSDLIVITNNEGMVIYASPSHEKKLGFDQEEMLGRYYSDILVDSSRSTWNECIASQHFEIQTVQLELKRKGETPMPFWIESQIKVVKDSNSNQIEKYVIISREITERKLREEKLKFMAYHDGLTLLPNRRFLEKEFSKLLLQNSQLSTMMALLYIDGDNFKAVNDEFGHFTGDEFIKQFAMALKSSVRADDIVARIGGDEFIVLLTNVSAEPTTRHNQVLQVISRIKATLATGWVINGTHFSPTSSIGIAYLLDSESSLDEIIDRADQALFKAKQMSKNSFSFADE